MANGDTKRSHVRIAAAILAALLVAATVFTYLSYTAAFTDTDTVTVTSPRAGLVMDTDAKVKYRGIQIGHVQNIDYAGDQAKLTLSIDSSQLPYVPSNAKVRIGGTTVFGAKAVEFLPPDSPTGGSLRPGAQVQASDVQLEVNTLFQTLTDVLAKIDPINLNATITALGEGLRGNGDDAGATVAGLNYYLQQLNPKLPTLQQDLQKTAVVGNIYADAAPDLVTVFDNLPTISKTLVDEQDNLNATLLAATGLANNGTATLAARRRGLHRRHPASAGAAERVGRVLTRDRLHLHRHRQGGGHLRAHHRRHPPGSVRRVELPARRARLHVSGEPADRERLRRPELPWPAERADQAVRRIVVSHPVPGHRQRLRAVPAEHRVAVRRAVDAAVPVQRRVRRTG